MSMIYEQHRRSLWRMARGMLLVGVAFAMASVFVPNAMSLDVYGAKAYAIDAEIWSMSFIMASALVLYGIHINGRKPLFTPILRLVGVGALIGLFLFLTVSAMTAPSGSVIVIFSALYFLPELIGFWWRDLKLLISRWRTHGYFRAH